METRRFLNQSQPQFLQSATLLLYINAVFALLRFTPLSIVQILGALCAFGIANDKKLGYVGGVVVAIIPLALTALLLLTGSHLAFNGLLSIIFEILLVVLLLHPMSRSYARIWFK